MCITELIEWLDCECPRWRDGDFKTSDQALVEELMIWLLRREPSYLDDIVPPCIMSGHELQWFVSLFDENASGQVIHHTIWSAFGYCEKGLLFELLHAESLELSYG